MSGYSRILVPLDFSEHSTIALSHACELAKRFEADLHILHVMEPWPPAASVTSELYPVYHDYVVQENAQATKALNELVVPDCGSRPVRRLARTGHVEQEIIAYIEEQGIDLCVLGTHGRTGISHWFMGSVAERVVRFAPCAVLVVRCPKSSH